MITAAKERSSNLFHQGLDAFESALRAGMKLQEDSARCCVDILRNVGSPLEWEQTAPQRVTKAVVIMQQNVDRSIQFMNESAQQTVSLLETAMQLYQANSDGSNDSELTDFWNYALNSMRTNAQTIAQANASVRESWRALSKEVLQRIETMREEVNRMVEMSLQQV